MTRKTVVRGARAAGLLLVLGALTARPRLALAASDVCYEGGPSLASFKLNGDAFLDASSIVITPDAEARAGSAMSETRLSAASDLHIKLVLRIATTSSIQPGDGMAFVMHNDARGTSVLGGVGDGLGYAGIASSVVVELDTFQNVGDPGSPHIAITRQGEPSHTHATNAGLPAPVPFASLVPPIDPTSGAPVHIWIDYAAATTDLRVFVASSDTRPPSAALATVLDLASELGADFTIGLTGSTGSRWDRHELLELHATDNQATAGASCCDTDADCAGSAHGSICDAQKHVCGQCRLGGTTSCAVGNTGCGLASAHNVCQTPCNGNFGAAVTSPCPSSAYPACRTAGLGAGSCGVCNGDFQSGSSAACATGAPFCASSGYCGRCTASSDCTAAGVSHTGVVCNTSSGRCIGFCTADAECGAGNACAASACAAIAANGQPIPGGTCDVSFGSRYCTSGVCTTSNATCGYASGTGPCTAASAATVCQSGTCSSGNVCIPAFSGSCYVDADCAASFFCRRDTFTCTAELAAGDPLPDDGLHGAACTDAVAAAVCASGLCNPQSLTCGATRGAGCTGARECQNNLCAANGRCGYLEGTGTCTGASAADLCQSGVCSTAGVCILASGCWVDDDCGSNTYCDRDDMTCRLKLAPGASIPDDGLHGGGCAAALAVCETGLCNPTTSTCAAALGAACTAPHACVGNTCGNNARCGLADGDGPCTAPRAASTCQSGICGPSGRCVPAAAGGCALDPDCPPGSFCNAITYTCVARLGPGTPLPSDRLHSGRCSDALAAAVCGEGWCNPATDTCARAITAPCTSAAECVANVCNSTGTCGYPPGAGSCTGANAGTLCASGRCSLTAGVCLGSDPDSCWVDRDCAANSRCDRAAGLCRPKIAPGAPIPDDGLHDGTCNPDNASAVCASGACNRVTHTCGAPAGSPCASASECSNGVCNGGGTCGHPPGAGPCTDANAATVCASGICGVGSGTCAAPGPGGCGGDADCGEGQYCAGESHTCRARLGPGVPLPQDGVHGDCDAGRNPACESGLCNAPRRTCASANSAPCSEASQCATNACGRNGGCGLANGQPGCTALSATLCQSGLCSESGVCGDAGCLQDGDCFGLGYCNAALGLCKARLAAGQPLPQDALHDGICTPALAQVACASGVCNPATGACAVPRGGPCAAGTDCAAGACGSNGRCGLAPGQPGCTSDNAATVCQSGACSSTGRCKSAGPDGCAADVDCGPDRYCAGATLTCLGKLGPGAAIPPDGLHDDGCLPQNAAAVCAAGICNARAGTCAAPPGQACQTDAQCAGNVCGTNGLCGAVDGAGPCDASDQSTVCQSGFCNVGAGLCQPAGPGPRGEDRCVRDADCGAFSYCDAAAFICTPQALPGAPLPTDPAHPGACDRKAADGVCTTGLCNPVTSTCASDNGAACTAARDCASNICQAGRCGLPDGQMCASANECRTGTCTGQACGRIPLDDLPIRASGGGCGVGGGGVGAGGLPLALVGLLLLGLLARRRS